MIRDISLLILFISSSVQAEFIRDNAKEIVKDSVTCLMWQDNSDSKTIKKDWQGAIEYCQNLNFADYSDWRLPNRNELISIRDMTRHNPAIKKTFLNVTSSSYYWSSTTNASDSSYACDVYFYGGVGSWHTKDGNNYVRCVRLGQ